MYKNINIYGNYYLVADLDPPERKRLLDRLEVDSDDIKKWNILHDRENKQWCISGKRIVNDFDFPQGYRQNVEIPVYTMSEVEEDQFKMSNRHYSAFFFTTENNMGKVTEKMRELGLDYRSNRKDFETKNPVSLFLAFNNTVYPCTTDKRTQNIMDTIGLDWDNFYYPPEPIDELISRQRKDLEVLEERCLSFIPYSCRTLPVCTEAAKNNPYNIKDIPGYLLTRKFVGNIIEMNPLNLGFIPVDRLDKNLCIQAIDKNSAAFIGLHEGLKTPELCERAFDNARKETDDPAYLKNIITAIPHAGIHLDLMTKFNKVLTVSDILKSIPENVLNREICQKAVNLQDYAIMDIPDRFKTEEMALKAFSADANLLYNVPDRYRTRELCLKALQRTLTDKTGHIILGAIPYPDIILDALKNKYKDTPIKEIVQFIPKEVLDEKLAYEIIRRDASCLPEIPFQLKDNDLCIKAILETKDIEPLYAIPKDSMSNTLCQLLITIYPQAFGCILPEDKRTADVCFIAIRKDETLKQYVPDSISNDKNMNIYRFGLLVDKQVKGLSLNQIQDLYDQKRVEIDYTDPTSQISRKVQIEFSPDTYSINYFDNVQDVKSQGNKQENTIPNKGKGLKM